VLVLHGDVSLVIWLDVRYVLEFQAIIYRPFVYMTSRLCTFKKLTSRFLPRLQTDLPMEEDLIVLSWGEALCPFFALQLRVPDGDSTLLRH
jgi:hypothetical protein